MNIWDLTLLGNPKSELLPLIFVSASNYGPLGTYMLLRSGLDDNARIGIRYPTTAQNKWFTSWRKKPDVRYIRFSIVVAWDTPPAGVGPYTFGASYMHHQDGEECDPDIGPGTNWQYWKNGFDVQVPAPNPLVQQTLIYDMQITRGPGFTTLPNELVMFQLNENLAAAGADLRVYGISAEII